MATRHYKDGEPCALPDCLAHLTRPCPGCGRVCGVPPTPCHAHKDGDCFWTACPQTRDNEPHKTGRTCPLSLLNPYEDF